MQLVTTLDRWRCLHIISEGTVLSEVMSCELKEGSECIHVEVRIEASISFRQQERESVVKGYPRL